MSKIDRESILKGTRMALTVLLECKKMAGIEDIFEINDKVFINNTNVVVPKFTVYDKKTQEVKTFSYILNDSRNLKFWDLYGESQKIQKFVDWLASNYKYGIHGDPCNWKEYNLPKMDIYEE